MRHRFTVLLVFIVTLLALLPFIRGDELAILTIKLVLSAILISGIYVARQMRTGFVVASLLALPPLVGRWVPRYSSDIRVFLAIDLLTAVFLLYITIMMLNRVLNAHRVTLDTIAGALCAYLLIGLTWAFVYRAMFVINPHSFVFASGNFTQIFETDNRFEPQLMNFAYYSYTALTTTGFGDITAASPATRGVSLFEAMAGQFFIAVLVARLVSLELVHSARGNRAEADWQLDSDPHFLR